jgi:hypothetical protein
MKLLADSMLGRLTRWLRLSGYDVAYLSSRSDDDEVLRRAAREERLLLSRDAKLCQRAQKQGLRCFRIESGDFYEQLKQVVNQLNVKLYETPEFSRCPRCNGEIKKARRENILDRVPEAVRERLSDFWECSACGKVYWEGSHWRNIKEVVRRVQGDVQDSEER